MTIPTTGPILFSHLRTEFMPAGSNLPVSLGKFRRGDASGYVKKNAANNIAVNRAASIPDTGPIALSQCRGARPGWDYTTTGDQANNIYFHVPFGDDNNVDWPKTYINNHWIYATEVSYGGFIIHGGAGRLEFINNNHVLGCGGNPNSGGGTWAVHINAAGCKPIVVNNGVMYAGGGAGGIGGNGGTGGTGYTQAWNYTGYVYVEGNIVSGAGSTYLRWPHSPAVTWVAWNGYVPSAGAGGSGYGARVGTVDGGDGYVYEQGAFQRTTLNNDMYAVRRRNLVNSYHGGGAGGGGGNGGYGVRATGVNATWGPTGGVGGAAGAGGGPNAGSGGYGGTGGAGGSWGAYGGTGNTGATGNGGNWAGGTGGTAGGGGGPPGQYVNAITPWTFINNSGAIAGLAPTVAPS